MSDYQQRCGLGNMNAEFTVYIANRPPLDKYLSLRSVKALQQGDIELIVNQTGNHWRKIFNVYAKLGFSLNSQGYETWQRYRDDFLLTKQSKQALLFSPPDLDTFSVDEKGVYIITGRTYAQSLSLGDGLMAINADFQVDANKRLVVAPYFDYRQLNNEKLAGLSVLIQQLKP